MPSDKISSDLIAARIRRLRQERSLRLEDVARRAGYTKGFLSKVENGKVSPPVATLIRVANALGVEVTDLLVTPKGERAVDPDATVHVKATERLEIENASAGPGYTYMALAAPRHLKMMEPFLMTVYPDQVDREKTFSHPGEEFIFVVKGKTDYRVGDEVFELKEGDSLYFDANRPHAPYPKDEPVTLLAIFGSYPYSRAEVRKALAENEEAGV